MPWWYMDGLEDEQLASLPGIGKARAVKLEKLGLRTAADFLRHFPRDYEERRAAVAASLTEGLGCFITAELLSLRESRPRKGLSLLKAELADGTGRFWATWFNQPWLKRRLVTGRFYTLAGRVAFFAGRPGFNNPEILNGDPDSGILPVYPLTEGVGQGWLRSVSKAVIGRLCGAVPEVLPAEVLAKLSLMGASEAWQEIHWPSSAEKLDRARTRLTFEELFFYEVRLAFKRSQVRGREGKAHPPDGELCRRFLNSLPFTLTPDQQEVIAEIRSDMEKAAPMNRLLQGDVGSGKTVVALWAVTKAVAGGRQAAIMVPTEVLAEQHFASVCRYLLPIGVRPALARGGLGRREKATLYRAISEGEVDVVVGTHALLQEGVAFRDLGLVVIDEQHRFGVNQRAGLIRKGEAPDVLVMTATPIPRTMSMTLYGDLDLSVIRSLPPGRRPVVTRWTTPDNWTLAYDFLMERIREGRQGYAVCPLVEESEALEVQAVEEICRRVSERYPRVRLSPLHGRMRPDEKETIMEQFRQGQLDLLVSTTVIEVGIDVPNATVMIIEGAERFGLSQLHQLRGRVGRGEYKSYCLMLGDPKTEAARRRLDVMKETNDGFVIAEEDLKQRGPGEILGTRQHGWPDLVLADPIRDRAVLAVARREAFDLVEKGGLEKYPLLARAVEHCLRDVLPG